MHAFEMFLAVHHPKMENSANLRQKLAEHNIEETHKELS